jgi:hypothetical protein
MKRKLLLFLLAGFCLIQVDSLGKATSAEPVVEETKKVSIRISPNPTFNGTIIIASNSSKKVHFYIFDLEGTMIHQTVLNPKQKQTVTNLKKGVYLYDVFLDDVSVEHGRIVAK